MYTFKTKLKPALIAGFIASVVFTLMGQIGAPHLIGQKMDVAVILAPTLGGSYALGVIAHFFTGVVVFPVAYLLIGLPILPGPGWLRGVIFLIIVYLVAMTVVMPYLGQGLFFNDTPKSMVALLGHVVYGLILGIIVGRPKKK